MNEDEEERSCDGFLGRRVLFINSINPKGMPFVEQQIKLLAERGLDIRVITRVFNPELPSFAGMLYDGFLSKTPPFSSRLAALLSAEVRGVLEPSFKEFISAVADSEHLGKLTASKQMHHWSKIIKLLESWRPELIHAHFAWHLPYAIPLGEYLGIPVICTAHHSDIYFEDDWAENLSHPRVSHIISIAESVHNYMMTHCPTLQSKTTLIYNPINPDFLQPLRPPLGSSRILNVASFKAIKNQNWLVRALAKLKEQGMEFHCDFVGIGDQQDAVQQLARDMGVFEQVTFHGFKTHAEVLAFMDSADVFVLSSESEGLPTVVTEALARGLAVIATDLPSTRDATRQGEYGTLVPLNDDSMLAASISRTLLGSGTTAYRAPARKWIEKEFSHAAHWEKLHPIYSKLLNR